MGSRFRVGWVFNTTDHALTPSFWTDEVVADPGKGKGGAKAWSAKREQLKPAQSVENVGYTHFRNIKIWPFSARGCPILDVAELL